MNYFVADMPFLSEHARIDRAEQDGYCDGDSGASDVLAVISSDSADVIYEWESRCVPDNSESASYGSYDNAYRRGYRAGFYNRMRWHDTVKPRVKRDTSPARRHVTK